MLERQMYRYPPFDWIRYYVTLLLPPCLIGLATLACCTYFFIRYRRRPSAIEIAVKNAKLKTGLDRKRVKLIETKPAKVTPLPPEDEAYV